MTLNHPTATAQPPQPSEPPAPLHPRFALEALADRLRHNHPRMAQEIQVEAARSSGLSTRDAWVSLQAEAAHIELRHLFGRGNADRNRWLAQLIRELPEPPVTHVLSQS